MGASEGGSLKGAEAGVATPERIATTTDPSGVAVAILNSPEIERCGQFNVATGGSVSTSFREMSDRSSQGSARSLTNWKSAHAASSVMLDAIAAGARMRLASL
jgi:hypothetical protein